MQSSSNFSGRIRLIIGVDIELYGARKTLIWGRCGLEISVLGFICWSLLSYLLHIEGRGDYKNAFWYTDVMTFAWLTIFLLALLNQGDQAKQSCRSFGELCWGRKVFWAFPKKICPQQDPGNHAENQQLLHRPSVKIVASFENLMVFCRGMCELQVSYIKWK